MRKVTLRCVHLCVDDYFDKLALYVSIFESTRIVGNGAHLSLKSDEVLEFAGKERFKNITGLTIQGDGLDSILPELIDRFETIKISDGSLAHNYNISNNVRSLFLKIEFGRFAGLSPRSFEYCYSWNLTIEDVLENGMWWIETKKLPAKIIWQGYKTCYTQVYNSVMASAFLLEYKDSVATVIMHIIDHPETKASVRLHMDIRSSFDPEATTLLLTENLFEDLPVDSSKIYEIIDDQDWNQLYKMIDLLREHSYGDYSENNSEVIHLVENSKILFEEPINWEELEPLFIDCTFKNSAKSWVTKENGQIQTCEGKVFEAEVFEYLLDMPWIIWPQDYEVECCFSDCNQLLPIHFCIQDDLSSVKCPQCKYTTLLGPTKKGFKWLLFECNHFQQVPADEWPANCEICLQISNYTTYSDVYARTPRKKFWIT